MASFPFSNIIIFYYKTFTHIQVKGHLFKKASVFQLIKKKFCTKMFKQT